MTYDQLVHNLRADNPIAKYREMGSRDKKTGKLKHYTITRHLIKNTWDCECPAAQFRRFQECKHVKKLKHKLAVS